MNLFMIACLHTVPITFETRCMYVLCMSCSLLYAVLVAWSWLQYRTCADEEYSQGVSIKVIDLFTCSSD